MTDKIIIDGIDVNGVVKQIECLTVQYDKVVEQNKQLQQELRIKTAECEELKIKLMQKDEVNAFFNTPIEGWSSDPCKICESKNEKIAYENKIEIYKEELKEYEDILDSRQREWEEENERYIQALDEIEEYCNKYGQNSIGFRKNILDIIKKLREGGE